MLSDYVEDHFYDHLCAATTVSLYAQSIFDDHPAEEILQALETKAYCVDEYSSGPGHITARRIIPTILRWVDMLNLCAVDSRF